MRLDGHNSSEQDGMGREMKDHESASWETSWRMIIWGWGQFLREVLSSLKYYDWEKEPSENIFTVRV